MKPEMCCGLLIFFIKLDGGGAKSKGPEVLDTEKLTEKKS